MMRLGFGKFAGLLHERKGGSEVPEAERPFDPGGVVEQRPVRRLSVVGFGFLRCERRDAAAARGQVFSASVIDMS